MIISRDKLGRIQSSTGRPPTPVDLDMAILLYNSGLSIIQTASAIGMSSPVIQRCFTKLGICRGKADTVRGRKRSERFCQAVSEGQKKRLSNPKVRDEQFKGTNNPFYGRRHKPETIANMKVKLSKIFSGEGNPQWQGGISLEPYDGEFKKIRKAVYERDGYQCQECGVIRTGNHGELVAHHKDANKKNSSRENLITLCRLCHGKITMEARWGKEVKTL